MIRKDLRAAKSFLASEIFGCLPQFLFLLISHSHQFSNFTIKGITLKMYFNSLCNTAKIF